MFKSIAAGAVITIGAGAAATGGAVTAANPFAAAIDLHHTSPGAAYGMAAYEHADPLHSDPGGEFIQIRAADNGGTASTFYQAGPYLGGL
jgi:hypothetical protein